MFDNIVTIQKKDKATGIVKEEITGKNSQTLGSIRQYFAGGDSLSDSLIVSYSPTAAGPYYFIQAQEVDLENTVNEATANIIALPGPSYQLSAITGISQPILTFDSVNKTAEYEFNGRLNPPTSGTRSLTAISLGRNDIDSSIRFAPGFGVILTAACTQDDTEILDVFYRVRITGDTTANDYHWAAWLPMKFYNDQTYDAGGVELFDESYSINVMGPNITHSYGYPKSNTRDKMPVAYEGGTGTSSGSESLNNWNVSQLTGVRNFSYGLNDQVGQTYNTFNFFSGNLQVQDPNQQLGLIGQNNASTYQFSHQILPDDINPLQGKFLHSTTAIRPYLDPSFLGSGQGDITFDGTNWNEDESLVYRLQFTTAGDVGTAEYKLYKKVIFGYPSNEYINEYLGVKELMVLPSQYLFDGSIGDGYIINKPDSYWVQGSTADFLHYDDDNFDNGLMPNVVRYDEKRLVCFNTSGLSIINVFTDDYFNIDSQSTPSLTTSAINDVTVNELNGEIWVATTDSGLFRISSDFLTVTSITVGATNVNELHCRSVDYKNNGDIWAAFDGGLVLSTDNGATWTEYNEFTTPEFSYTGISDSNWGNIQGIVVDKDSADDRLLIATSGTKASAKIVWWSRAGSAVSSDALDSTILSNSQNGSGTSGEIYSNSQAFGVRKWIKYFPGTNGTFIMNNSYRQSSSTPQAADKDIRTIDFGSTSLRASVVEGYNTSDIPSTSFVAFERDSSGNYGFLRVGGDTINTGSTGNYTWVTYLYTPDLTISETWTDHFYSSSSPAGSRIDYTDWNSDAAFYIEYMKRGIAVASLESRLNIVNRIFSDSAPFGDSTYTSVRDVMWEEYGWDGANWVLDNPNSRVVHGTQETLIDGLSVQFADVGSPNFVLNEYVDMNVFTGIHNDNATEFSFSVPVTVRNSAILTDLSQSTVPASALGAVTNKELNFITNTGLPTSTDQNLYNVGGEIGTWMNDANTTDGDGIDHVVFSEIVFDGDFSVTFKTTKNGRDGTDARASFGVLPLTSKGSSTTYNDPNYMFHFSEDQFSVRSGLLGTNSTLVVDATILAKADTYTIERVGTDLNFRVNGTIIHTEAGVDTTPWVVQAGFLNESFRTFYDMNIDSYTENGYIVQLGDSGSTSGVFDPRFAMVEAYLDPVTSSFTIGGVDAPVNVDPHSAPAAGSVTLYSKSGWVKFNSADTGAAITGEYQTLYKFN